MTEEDIELIIEAITDDFSLEEIANSEFMKIQLRALLGMNDAEIRVFLPAVQAVKALRGDRAPLWAKNFQRH